MRTSTYLKAISIGHGNADNRIWWRLDIPVSAGASEPVYGRTSCEQIDCSMVEPCRVESMYPLCIAVPAERTARIANAVSGDHQSQRLAASQEMHPGPRESRD